VFPKSGPPILLEVISSKLMLIDFLNSFTAGNTISNTPHTIFPAHLKRIAGLPLELLGPKTLNLISLTSSKSCTSGCS